MHNPPHNLLYEGNAGESQRLIAGHVFDALPRDHTHNALALIAGTVPTARLGSGTADATTYLRGDQTWATVAAGSTFDAVQNAVFAAGPRSHIHQYRELTGLTTASLLGRGSSGTGFVEAITLDSTMQISAGALGISGFLALAKGGTASDLSGTGGANQFVKQSSAGAALTVGTISVSDLPISDGSTILANQAFKGLPRPHSHNALDLVWGTLPAGRLPALTGDVTTTIGTVATTIANDAVTYAKMQNVATTDRLLGLDAAAPADPTEIAVSGGIEFTGLNAIQTSAFTGDVTKAAGGTVLTLAQTDNVILANRVFAAPPRTPWMGLYPQINFLGDSYIRPSPSLLEVVATSLYLGTEGNCDFGSNSAATYYALRPKVDLNADLGAAALAWRKLYLNEYYLRSTDSTDGFYTKVVSGQNLTADNTLTLTVTASNTLTLSGNLTVESASLINQDLTTDSTVATFATAQGTTSLISGSTGAANGLTLNATSLISNKTNQDVILDPNGTGQIVAMGDATQAIVQFQGSGGFANKPFINGADGSLKFGATGTTYRLELTTGHSVTMYPESGITSGQIYLGGGFAATTQLATTTASASGDTTLFSQAITFTNTGEMLEMTATGTMAASASVTKAIKVKYDTKTITIYSALLNTAEDWVVKVRVWKASSGVKIIAECFTFGSVATTKIDYDTHTAASGTLSIIGNLSGTLTNGVVLEAGGPLVWWNQ